MMTTTEIITAIENADHSYFALRMADAENLNVGDELRPSRVWDDGNVVVDEDGDPVLLNGTCGMGIRTSWDGSIDEIALNAAIRAIQIYYGDQLLLIGGDYMQGGEDAGEVIIRNAKVVAIIN